MCVLVELNGECVTCVFSRRTNRNVCFLSSASAVIFVIFLKETVRASDIVGKQRIMGSLCSPTVQAYESDRLTDYWRMSEETSLTERN